MKKVINFILGLLGLTAACHVAEWFIVGRHVAEAADIPVIKALPQCLLRGFLWWKPIKKELESK